MSRRIPSLRAVLRDPQVLVGASRATVPLVAIAAGIMLSRELGPEGRGHVATAVLDVEVASVVVGLGLPVAARSVVARGVWSPEIVLGITRRWNRWLLGPAILVAALAFASTAAGRSGDAVTMSFLFMAAAGLATDRLLAEGIASATAGYRFHAAVSVLLNVIPLVIITLAYVSGRLSITVALMAYLTGHLVAAWFARRSVSAAAVGRDVPPELDRELRQAWRGSTVPHLLEYMNSRLDLLLLSLLASTEQVGLFAVAASAARLPGVVTQVATITVASKLTVWRRTDARALRRFLVRYGIVVVGVSLLAGATGSVLIPLLYGSDFSESAVLLWILLLGTCLLSIAAPATIVLLTDARTREAAIANAAGTLATAIGVVAGFQLGGLRWAAAGSTLGFGVTAAVLALVVRAQGPRPQYPRVRNS